MSFIQNYPSTFGDSVRAKFNGEHLNVLQDFNNLKMITKRLKMTGSNNS